ncbi:MAG: FMN-binding protein [Chloroflexota bacterium]
MTVATRPSTRRRTLGLLAATGSAAALLTTALPQLVAAQSADASPSPLPSLDPCAAPVASLAPDASPTPAPSVDPLASPAASPAPDALACASPAASPLPSPSAIADVTLTGQTVDTRFGPVQVQVTLEGSTIVDVQPLQMPNDRPRSARITQIVTPMLHDDVIAQQSARIHVISGATYTVQAYAMSVQSALDQAAGA